MRAIQITEFGGPEVLVLRELPDPVRGRRHRRARRRRRRRQLRRHPPGGEHATSPRQQLPLIPGAEVVGRTPDGRRVVALAGRRRVRGEGPRSRRGDWRLPDAVDRRRGARARAAGRDRLAPAAHERPPAREGESVVVIAGAGGVGTLAVQLAKRLGAGRVIAIASTPGEARARLELGADAAVDGWPARRTSRRRCARPTAARGRRRAGDGRRPDVRRAPRGAGAVRPAGALRHGRSRGRPEAGRRPGSLMATSRAVIGFWLAHCMRRPELMTEAMADLSAWSSRATCAPSSAGPTRWRTPGGHTRTCARAGRSASSC